MKYLSIAWLFLLSVCCTVSSVCCSASAAEDTLSFNHDIRPILSDYCFACHGPDANHREADLRLDERDAAIDYGAIVPNETDASLLVERILSEDPDLIMPPPKGGKKLSDEQKQTLVRWIQQGATYQSHWSFEPVPETVSVPDAGGNWARNDIDRFIARTHDRKGLHPTPEVDRSTWLRRVSFDLTGLPPSVAELNAFAADQSDEAYEKVVDRLLNSDAYGERMANMWLDVARYADTFGYQNDVAMEVWPWRDWVIDAFNQNMPYDRFITEQIAGDLLPNATMNQRLATAFNRLHRQTNEGGSVPEEFRLTGISDRTTTAGTAFLGLTLECCRCHDHKFDPIAQRDFYRMSAYFADIDELGLYSHFTYSQPTPAMLLYQGQQQQQHQEAKAAVERARQRYDEVLRRAESDLRGRRDELSRELPKTRDAVLHLPLDGDEDGVANQATRFNGDKEVVCDGAPEFGRTSPFSFSLWVNPAVEQPRMIVLHQSVAAEDSGFRGLQLNINNGHPEFSMIHFWPGNAVRVQSRSTIPVGQWSHLAVTHDGSGTAAGIRLFVNGERVDVAIVRDNLSRDIRHRKEWGDMKAGNVKLALGARFRDIGFRDGLMDELHVFDVQLSGAEIATLFHGATSNSSEADASDSTESTETTETTEQAAVTKPSSSTEPISAAQTTSAIQQSEPIQLTDSQAIGHELLTNNETVAAARKELQTARDQENEIVTGIREIMVMRQSPQAPPTHVLERGEYTEKRDQVSAGVPEFLGEISTGGKGRVELANWITHPQNPLTSRVISNRMWHLFFGRGIVVTLEDFGSQGTPPSHPQLLDYLARTLMNDNWDLKSFCRRVVLSATYRQSSAARDASAIEQDPGNVWLARGPKHRLSAEQLRDAVLSASGLLVRKIGGPSVMPYQPAGLWREAGTGKSYKQSTGEGLYRRSLYTFWKRTAPPPSMLTFDATSRESCTPRRELTTTPLQALVFLNDPQYVESARVLAEQLVIKHGDSLDGRCDELFQRLISRLPTEKERALVKQMYDEQRKYFEAAPDNAKELLNVGESELKNQSIDPLDLAATTVVVQTIIAYDETIMLR